MKTATKKKKSATTKARDLIERHASERGEIMQAADELVFRLARGEEIGVDGYAVLESVSLTGEDLDRQIKRAEQIDLIRERPYDSKALDAAKAEADAALADLQKQLPILKAEIEEAERKLDALRQGAEGTARTQSEIEQRRNRLRELAPAHVHKASQRLEALARKSIAAELGPINVRLKQLEQMLSRDITKDFDRDRLIQPVCDRNGWKVADWSAHCEDFRREQAELLQRKADVEARIKPALEQARAMLEVYL